MELMIKEGIELDRAYSFQFCSPSRSSLQSGRLATHVNVKNLGTNAWNPADPVSGFSGIPIPMTGMAEHLKKSGYQTHQVGAEGGRCVCLSVLPGTPFHGNPVPSRPAVTRAARTP